MSGKLLSIPKAPTGSFPAVLRLLDTYFSSLDPLPQKQRGLDTMLLYLKNIFMSPKEEKYRSIRMRNAKYSRDIGQCPGADLILLEIGFQKKVLDFEQYLVLPLNVDISTDYWRVKKYKELMDAAILSDGDAPRNKLRAEKEAKEAAIRQIEEDSRLRKQKQERHQYGARKLGPAPAQEEMQRSATYKARLAAIERLEALARPVVVAETMLPTPSLTHLKEDDYERLYEPAEDSFALLDALQNDQALIKELQTCPLVLEVGSGTGIVSTFLQQSILPSSLHFCTDINEFACKATMETSTNNVHSCLTSMDTIRTSLLDGFRASEIDLLVFNPPYVPTTMAEIDTSGGIAAAWAGGLEGMDVTSQLIARASSVLSATGLFYLVAVARNKPAQIVTQAAALGLQGRVVLERRAGREKLSILRFHKAIDTSFQPSPIRESSNTTTTPASTTIGRETDTVVVTETRRLDGQTLNIPTDSTTVGALD